MVIMRPGATNATVTTHFLIMVLLSKINLGRFKLYQVKLGFPETPSKTGN